MTDVDMPISEPWYALGDIYDGDAISRNDQKLDHKFPKYTAKATDFGYSTQYAGMTDLISMPKSDPWYAPEWHHRGFTPAQATKMDSYSFSMLVLWLLSYSTEAESVRKFRNDLYLASNDALTLAHRKMGHLDSAQRLTLQLFFEKISNTNGAGRCSDFLHLRDIIGSDLYTFNQFHCEGG